MSPARRRIIVLLAAVVLAFPIGTRLAGETPAETALGQVAFSLQPALAGGAEVYVPITEWGMRFQMFDVPVLVRVEPRSVDRDGALEVAAGNRSLLEATQRDLLSGALKAALVNTLAVLLVAGALALIGAALLGLPLGGTALRAVLANSLLIALLALVGWLTYSESSLSSPTLYARGAELKQLIDTVERERSDAPGSYGSNFDRVLRGAGRFLAAEPTQPTGTGEALLGSDIHNNAPALDALGRLAGDDPVFLPGDFGFQGSDGEAALLAPRIADLGRTVIATSGNHDSSALMLSLAREEVIVLGQRGRLLPDGSWSGPAVRKIAGLRVAGFRDPLEWTGDDPEDPERIFSFDELEDGQAREDRAQDDLWKWWKTLASKPDVLLVHQPDLAESLAQRIFARTPEQDLTILVGHDHQQWLARYGNVVIVDGGSAGAGGLFGIGSEAAETATLHFGKNSGDLEAADFVAVEPISGASRAERVIVSDVCDSPCRYRVSSISRNWGIHDR